MNKIPRRLVVIALVALTISGCKDTGDAAGAGQAPPPPAAPFVLAEQAAVVVEDTLPGRVSALREAEVRPQVGGILRARLFEEGDTVQEGQDLYQIDPDMFRADVSSARSNVTRARAGLELAEREAERAQQLSESGISSGRELEAATTQLALARADLQNASAMLRRSSLNLQYAKVTAPISGRISISRVSEGALVSPADPQPLTVIQQIDEVYVDVKQPLHRYEELRALHAAGKLVDADSTKVSIVSMQGTVYSTEGRLLFTDTMVDPSTSEVTLRVLVPNADRVLLPGMFVRAMIPQGVAPNSLLVPQQAVQHDATFGPYVLVIDEENNAQMRHVTYGRVVNGKYVITDGLQAGERVVVEGLGKIRPGTPVSPVAWGEEAAPAQP